MSPADAKIFATCQHFWTSQLLCSICSCLVCSVFVSWVRPLLFQSFGFRFETCQQISKRKRCRLRWWSQAFFATSASRNPCMDLLSSLVNLCSKASLSSQTCGFSKGRHAWTKGKVYLQQVWHSSKRRCRGPCPTTDLWFEVGKVACLEGRYVARVAHPLSGCQMLPNVAKLL